MPNIHLTIATVDYDHVRDFREGRVTASGIDATWLNIGLHEMFARFLTNREWDVSELSFAKFIAEATRPDADIIGLPVYPRREFRFGIYYVNRAQGIRAPADSLSEMLDTGEIAGLIGASVPACFGKNPDVVRLFPDFVEQDKRFYARTGVFPIMHVLAIRKAILRDNPWVARNLFNAFDESRRRSLARLRQPGHFALPWLPEHAAAMQETFGGDYFPYGIDENRAALELFLRYAYEQGIAQRQVMPEEIFPAGIMVSGHA
jgi:hypothetical protein